MKIATRLNDIINLDQANTDGPTVSEEELAIVFGGSGGGGGGGGGGGAGGTFSASDAAFDNYQAAQQNYETHRDAALENAGNLQFGTATREANEAYNAYQNMQDARAQLEQAVDADVNAWGQQNDASLQNYTPVDGNMSNPDGTVGVGYSGDSSY